MEHFFFFLKFLGVCFLVYTCLKMNHWVLALFILLIGGVYSGVGNTVVTVNNIKKREQQ